MAAGIVYHNFTTSSGVTFPVPCWVPDTAAPDVGVVPVHALMKTDGTILIGPQLQANSLPFVFPTDMSASKSLTLTRPNDTSAYAANDVLGAATGLTAALQFTNMGRSGSRIMITGCSLEIDASAIITNETSYDLHLYNITPPSALGDNAAWDLPSGDRAAYLGKVSLGAPADLGSTLYIETFGLNKQVQLSGTDLFAYLVTVGGHTPTANRVYIPTLHAIQI